MALNQLWSETSRLSEEEQKRSETIFLLSKCFHDVFAYNYDLLNASFQGAAGLEKRIAIDKQRFLKTEGELTALASRLDRKQDSSKLSSISDVARQLARDAEQLVTTQSDKEFTSNIQRLNRMQQMMEKGLSFTDLIQKRVTEEENALDATRRDSDAARKNLTLGVLAGFIAVIVTASIALIYFGYEIIMRLRVLARHAASFPNLGKQNLSGRDEFAYLDQVLRDSARELRSAAEHRKSLMQMLAHDICSPIAATRLYIDMAQELLGESLSSAGVSCCNTVRTGLMRVHDFVTELLTAEKLESEQIELKITRFTLGELIGRCLQSLTPLAEKKSITITNKCDDTTIYADRTSLDQVLSNYLSNAIKFSPREGTIEIKSEHTDDWVKVLVCDSGPGLSPASQLHVFERFQQADNKAQALGFGLGLWIARMMIEAHGGTVGVTSQPGRGSNFWFCLPVDASTQVPASKSASRDAKPSSDKPVALSDLPSSKIFQGAASLVFAVLMLQSGWLLFLYTQLSSSEQLAQKERLHSNVVVSANHLLLNMFKANTGVAFFLVSKSNSVAAMAGQNIKEARTLINAMPVEENHEDSIWRETKSFATYEIAALEKMLTGRSPDETAVDLGLLGMALARADDITNRMHNLLEHKAEQLALVRSEQDKYRKRVQLIVPAAIIANLSISIAFLLLFTSKITKRVHTLVTVAQKLPERMPISEQITGTDELYQIYWLLLSASLNLKDAHDYRQALMNMVAHDIRSPLMAVQESLHLLAKTTEISASEKCRHHIANAEDNLTRVLSLVNDLLLINKLEEGKLKLERELCPLDRLVDASIGSIESLAASKAISIERACTSERFSLDRERMIQVLVNLLGNAIKFSPLRSSVCISAAIVDGSAEMRVKDNGPGIAQDDVDRIFERFYTSKDNSQSGFGLGLAISKLIVESHGGKISAESAPGKGTEFIIVLPPSEASKTS
ncbi:MAG TPA: HAMP domain-containing sensor histidine kinase [Candidatus Obscuribacterales bacterium]